jgi:hypothetical protein
MDLLDAELQGIKPMVAGSDDFAKAMSGDGRYLWALDDAGQLGIVSAQSGIKHTVITESRSVLGAGQLTVRNGQVTLFDNMTGTIRQTVSARARSSNVAPMPLGQPELEFRFGHGKTMEV